MTKKINSKKERITTAVIGEPKFIAERITELQKESFVIIHTIFEKQGTTENVAYITYIPFNENEKDISTSVEQSINLSEGISIKKATTKTKPKKDDK